MTDDRLRGQHEHEWDDPDDLLGYCVNCGSNRKDIELIETLEEKVAECENDWARGRRVFELAKRLMWTLGGINAKPILDQAKGDGER